MRLSRIIPIVLMIGGASTLALSCAPKQATSTAQPQIVAVQRGNLEVDITAVGNLALSQTEDLAFEIPGTVQDVTVQVGDTVKKGQVLATLDTTQWDVVLTNDQARVTADQRALTSAKTSAQNTLRNDQLSLVKAQNLVATDQLAVTSAQYALQTDNNTLNAISAVKSIQDQIDNANDAIRYATAQARVGGDISYVNVAAAAQQSIKELNAQMKVLLSGASLTVSSDVALQVAKAQLAIQTDQLTITKAQLTLQSDTNALTDAQNQIALDQEDIQTAQDKLKTDQKTLDDDKKNRPQVTAPFDGFITSVSTTAIPGADVKKGAIVVTIADPTQFQADVLVNETDISKIRLSGLATVVPQASTSTSLSANITRIAPTATIQQGVVNYKVTVGLQSLQPAAVPTATRPSGGNLTAAARPGGNLTAGNARGGGAQGIASANLTQAQIDQLVQQRLQAAGGPAANLSQAQIDQLIQQRQQALAGQAGAQSPGAGAQAGGRSQAGAGQSGQAPRQFQTAAASTTNIKLAAGMTVTVTIPVDTRTNVVLVPNGAITTKGGQASVNVINSANVTENRVIQVGIADAKNTEVTSGLSAEEKVLVAARTSSTTTSANANRPATTPVRIPGLGGF